MPASISAGRQQQSRVTLIVAGRNLGVWDDKTGGDTDSNSVQYFLGGGGPRVSLGGQQQVNNIVLQRIEDDEVIGFTKWLVSRAGRANPANRATCAQQKIDDDGNPIGDPFVWTGNVKRVKPSDVQSQANAAAQIEVELEISGPMT